MVDLKIDSDVDHFINRVLPEHKRQVPYAASLAINDTLKDARSSLIAGVRARQKSKRAWWANKETGILRTFASKRKLVGSIYTKMNWARLQEFGGIKTPHTAKHIAIPTDKAPQYARKRGGIKLLLEKRKTFAINKGVYRRKGPKKNERIERLHVFSKSARIKPWLRLRSTTEKVARRRFKKYLTTRVIAALRSAR